MFRLLIITLSALAMPAIARVSETPVAALSAPVLFTDEARYSSYVFCEDPTSLLETQKAGITLAPGYRRMIFRSDDTAAREEQLNAFTLPITITDPGRILFKPHYSFTGTKTLDGHINNLGNRFGFLIAAQTKNKAFRFAGEAEAQIGTTKYDVRTPNDTDALSRIHYDVPSRLALYLGSQPGEAVRFTVFGRTSLLIDTLHAEDTLIHAENMSALILPSVGFDINIGKEGFPWLSNFVWSYSRTNFTLSSPGVAGANLIGDPDRFEQINDADALVCDSIAWQWSNLGRIPVKDIMVIKPGADLSYWHGRYKQLSPQGKNRPYGYKDEQDNWGVSAFHMGFGLGFSIGNYADLNGEYSRSFVHIVKDTNPVTGIGSYDDKKTGYSRFGIGAKTSLQNYIVPLSKAVELNIGLGFSNTKENGLDTRSYRDDFSAVIGGDPVVTQRARYTPWSAGYLVDLTTNRFTMDLGTTFFEKQLGVDFSWGFMSRKVEANDGTALNLAFKGFEFGVDLIYNKYKF